MLPRLRQLESTDHEDSQNLISRGFSSFIYKSLHQQDVPASWKLRPAFYQMSSDKTRINCHPFSQMGYHKPFGYFLTIVGELLRQRSPQVFILKINDYLAAEK